MTLSVTQALRSSAFAEPGTPVVLLLHGFGSDAGDLAGAADVLVPGAAWVALRAPIRVPGSGYAWFPIVTPGDPAPEPVAEATEAIWAWVDAELPSGTAVIPVGFSQGGLMASELLRTRPQRVPAAVVLGGFVQRTERVGDVELAQTRPPVFWGRGADDTVIAPAAIGRSERWFPAHTTLDARIYAGLGHGINADEAADVSAFVQRHLLARSASTSS